MTRHTDDQIEQAERSAVLPDEITASAIHRLSQRVIELEAVNAALLAACEKGLAWFKSESAPEELDNVISGFRTAITLAKGGKR